MSATLQEIARKYKKSPEEVRRALPLVGHNARNIGAVATIPDDIEQKLEAFWIAESESVDSGTEKRPAKKRVIAGAEVVSRKRRQFTRPATAAAKKAAAKTVAAPAAAPTPTPAPTPAPPPAAKPAAKAAAAPPSAKSSAKGAESPKPASSAKSAPTPAPPPAPTPSPTPAPTPCSHLFSHCHCGQARSARTGD